MAEALLGTVVFLVSALGAVALIVRLARAVGRSVLSSAEIAAARTIRESSARRGDLTRMREGERVESRARAERRRSAVAAGAWFLWLVLPPAVGLLPAPYLIAAPLWLIPRHPQRAQSAEERQGE